MKRTATTAELDIKRAKSKARIAAIQKTVVILVPTPSSSSIAPGGGGAPSGGVGLAPNNKGKTIPTYFTSTLKDLTDILPVYLRQVYNNAFDLTGITRLRYSVPVSAPIL